MTRLLGAQAVVIIEAKVRDYLLNDSHSIGAGKAKLLTQFSFSRPDWPILMAALRRHPIDNAIVETTSNAFGTKHILQCQIASPDDRNPCIITVWIAENGQAGPRLITAYAGPPLAPHPI